MKKNLYKKFQKEKSIIKNYDDSVKIEKSQRLKTVLSFLSDLIGNLIKIIFYVLIVALCSLGATYLFNLIIRGGNL